MIDETGANLRGRSEFIAALDISPTREIRRHMLEQEAAQIREALLLDEAWQASPLPVMVEETAEKLGSTYTTSSSIGPWLEISRSGPQLPLRLGARVREIFIAGDGDRHLEAARGQLIMHRSIHNGEIRNRGFFVLFTKEQGKSVPTLTYGRTNLESDAGTGWNQLLLEVFLSSEQSFLRSASPVDVANQREQLHQFNVQQIIGGDEEKAKATASAKNITWQKAYLEIFARSSSRQQEDRFNMLGKLFVSQKLPLRFRRDRYAKGILRQNEGPYIDGQDCSEVQGQLQSFFDQVHDPINTRPDQHVAALADLEHGTHLEAVDTYQISEIDIARSIAQKGRNPDKPTTALIIPLVESDFPYYVRDQLRLDYSKYPDLKELIDSRVAEHSRTRLELLYPGISEIVAQGYKSEAWIKFKEDHPNLGTRILFDSVGVSDIYNGRSSFLGGLPIQKHEKLMADLAQMKVKPSPLAFPFD